MTKDKFNSKLREYSKTLSPKVYEQDLIGKVYQSFNDLFGVNNCVQIGSYPRFTSITPIHDLDILYILGSWDENNHTPSATLQKLFNEINNSYVNPTSYTKKISLQTHSVTVEFWENTNMVLSVDIVPAYSYGKNEYNQDTYKVPEVVKEKSHSKRNALTWNASDSHSWINSDPRGYIKVATEVGINTDFRKTVKFIKRWKNNLCDQDQNLKLKSFHLEQVVTQIFKQNPNIEIFDAVFTFFVNLPAVINTPNQIQDRANSGKFIDDYLEKFTFDQKNKIGHARDGFLIKLENLKESDSAGELMPTDFYSRPPSEVFMFDQNIKTLTEDQYDFKISGEVQVRNGGFREFILDKIGLITIDRKIKFLISGNSPRVDIFKWKVKNDNSSDEPRGEITDHRTKNEIENTKFRGNHYVECYAIKNNVCVGKSRQNVVLNRT